MMYKIKKDKYSKARRGGSKFLDLSCTKCGNHIAYYQKDGVGMLKRLYIDRFLDIEPSGKELICSKCGVKLGSIMIYEKESRPAYRLVPGAISKNVYN